ncbi:cyclase family protein [Legionella quinlivanii]|uniref:cyclase family protein n=1 Tax=Legionella quinlivanii TaxID=45073 RepID=UPI003460A120
MEVGEGTHMDAPAHCVPGGASVEQIPLSQLAFCTSIIPVFTSFKCEPNKFFMGLIYEPNNPII